MKMAFVFEEDGRIYSCRAEEQRRGTTEAWWWFDVSGDSNRYAPFRVAREDSEDSVRQRVVAYYAERLAPRTFLSWRDRHAARKTV